MKQLLFILLLSIISVTDAFSQIPKRVLVEKYTSARCGACPNAALQLLEMTNDNPNIIWISLHAGSYFDGMMHPSLDTLATVYNNLGSPVAAIDRIGSATLSSTWENKINQQLAQSAPVDIQIQGIFNPFTQLVEAKVSATFDQVVIANGEYRINLYVVEDSFSRDRANFEQANFYNDVAGHYYENAGNPIVNFPHRHVVRDVPSHTWGTPFIIPNAPEIDSTYSVTYSFELPNFYDSTQIRFVAFITDYDSDNFNNSSVLNAQQTFLKDLTVDIKKPSAFVSSFKIQPNPAFDFIQLAINSADQQEVNISIANLAGQTVFIQNNQSLYVGENFIPVHINNFASGIYFVNISNGNMIATQKLIVKY